MSRTTPITVRGRSSGLLGMVNCRPTGSTPGQKRWAALSLTMATHGEVSTSCSPKSRPDRIDALMDVKNEGVTRRYAAVSSRLSLTWMAAAPETPIARLGAGSELIGAVRSRLMVVDGTTTLLTSGKETPATARTPGRAASPRYTRSNVSDG